MRARCSRDLLPFLFILLLLAPPSWTQTPPTTSPGQEADALYQKQDWAGAAKAYEALTKREAANARAWFRLGVSLQSLGKLDQAVSAYQKAVEINHHATAMYNLATVYARLKNRDQALEWLEKSAEAGFSRPDQLAGDADLASLRDDPRFKAVAAKIQVNAKPCAASAEARQFDFWVGEWDVRTVDGQPAGTNAIQLTVGDCVLLENWTDSQGGTGKSINVYNADKKKWQQTWVDDHGNVTEYVGELKDGVMQFTAEKPGAQGGKTLRRMNFYPLAPGKVRQLGQSSTDGGKTWTTDFDLTYNRVKRGEG